MFKFDKSNITKIDLLILTSIFFIFLFYFYGFLINENSAGGGKTDSTSIWLNQKIFFENNLKDAIGHKDYHDSRSPIVYILHKYLNFYPDDIGYYKRIVFKISFLGPVIFFFILKEKYKVDKIKLAFISSILLLSPYYRTSSYWGLEENYGLIFLLLTYLTILKSKKNFYYLTNNIKIFIKIFLICFLSSLTFYFDQKLIIIPILSLFFIFKNFKNNELKNSIIIYSILSIPYIYFMFIWNGIVPPAAFDRAFKFNWENLGYMTTIIGFYLLPFLIFKDNLKKNLKKFFFNKINLFLLLILIIYLVYFYNSFDSFNRYSHGNGVIHKLIELQFENIQIIKILTLVSIFLFSLIILFFFISLHDRLIILFFLVTSVLMTPIYQEYLDPLMFLLIFTFFKEKINISNNFLALLFFYFSIFIVSCNFYYKTSLFY